jgi:hypothetical protein
LGRQRVLLHQALDQAGCAADAVTLLALALGQLPGQRLRGLLSVLWLAGLLEPLGDKLRLGDPQ